MTRGRKNRKRKGNDHEAPSRHLHPSADSAAGCGAKLPDNSGEDSFSLLPLLKGEDKPVRENAISANGTPALRSGSWKYVVGPESGQPVQLYHLADDLAENKNLAAAMPEKVAEMKALLEKLITDGRSTPGTVQKNDVEVRWTPKTGQGC